MPKLRLIPLPSSVPYIVFTTILLGTARVTPDTLLGPSIPDWGPPVTIGLALLSMGLASRVAGMVERIRDVSIRYATLKLAQSLRSWSFLPLLLTLALLLFSQSATPTITAIVLAASIYLALEGGIRLIRMPKSPGVLHSSE